MDDEKKQKDKRKDGQKYEQEEVNEEKEEKGIPTIYTPVPEEVVREIRVRRAQNKILKPLYLILIDVYFMSRKMNSLECPAGGSLRAVLQTTLTDVKMIISNHFSFYVYISPYNINWGRNEGELMLVPVKTDIFRHLVTPDEVDLSLKSIILEHRICVGNQMNVYIFIKKMNDYFIPRRESSKEKLSMSWRLENVFGN